MLQSADGSFYGVTATGGFNASGTVFHLDAAGTLTTLHSFSKPSDGITDLNNDGNNPAGSLAQSSEGNIYGTASGGIENGGTAYEITPAGVLTVLCSFPLGGTGDGPNGLTRGQDGNFYGLTTADSYGGGSGFFQITPSGALTVLRSFSSEEVFNATTPLLEGSDGSFYGACQGGGANAHGAVFKLSPTGTLTPLYAFTGGADGDAPVGPIALGGDGSIYGTTAAGGAAEQVNGNGTLYKVSVVATSSLPTVTAFKRGDGTVVQGSGSGVVFVERTGDTSGPLTVAYRVKGTAHPTLDYKPLSGSVTIPAGSTKGRIKIKPTGNEHVNGTRTVKIKLLPSVGNAYFLGTPDDAKIKVVKND